MTTTTTPTNPRADRARFIASTAGQWLKCHTPAGKRYGIRSSTDADRVYLVGTRTCTCPDFQRRGLPCKHVLAVQIHVARVRTEQAEKEVKLAA